MKNSLTVKESTDLDRLEKVVQTGKATFVAVGLALTEIRERRLYRKDYDTFEVYCQQKWGWARQRAHQLINAAVVVQQLPTDLSTTVDTERSARELQKVPESRRAAVVAAIKATGKPATAKSIVAAAKAVKPELEEIQLDGTGMAVPKHCLPLWDRGTEVQGLLTIIRRLKSEVMGFQKDPLFCEVNFQMVDNRASELYLLVKTALPYAICKFCNGAPQVQVKGKCTYCHGRGFVSKFRWESTATEKDKTLREKLSASRK